MSTSNSFFDDAFKALTGHPPFPWQESLYERFVSERADNIPSSCSLPTGLGKTNVIVIWLIALLKFPGKLPPLVRRSLAAFFPRRGKKVLEPAMEIRILASMWWRPALGVGRSRGDDTN